MHAIKKAFAYLNKGEASQRTKRCFLNKHLASLLACFITLSALAADLDTPLTITLPEQPLQDSLITLGESARLSIIFQPNLKLGITAREINGKYTPREILDLLFEGTDIQWRSFSNSAISLTYSTPEPQQEKQIKQQRLSEILVMGTPVTGSRLKQIDVDGNSPVDIITRVEIEAHGGQTLSDFLRFLPSVAGNSTNTAVNNGGDGTATITLRGLPASSTLVLINGKRIANNGLAGESADLNTIPLSAVDRIEILKDGASSIYGSDAIAGVVNVILKDQFTGLVFDQYYGQTVRNDLETIHTSLTTGFDTETTNIMLNMSFLDQGTIYSRDRDVSATANNLAQGGVDQRSYYSPETVVSIADNFGFIQRYIPDSSTADPTDFSNYRLFQENDRYDYAKETTAISPTTRKSLLINTNSDIGDDKQLLFNASYVETDTYSLLAADPVLIRGLDQTNSAPLIYSQDPGNPIYPFGFSRRFTEMGPRKLNYLEKASRLSINYEQNTGSWHWNTAINLNRTDGENNIEGLVNSFLLEQAIAPECSLLTDCVPLDIYRPAGTIPQNELNFVRDYYKEEGRVQLFEWLLNGDYVFDIKGIYDPGIAAGVVYRQESMDFKVSGHPITSFPSISRGKRDIYEAYLEGRYPIIQGLSYLQLVELNVAGRISKYNHFGTTQKPKIGLRIMPMENLILRANYARGFRAPSLSQMHKEGTIDFQLLFDPCASANGTSLPGCPTITNGSPSDQYRVLTLGNPDLQPEQSVSKTLGLVWRHHNAFRFSVDWFDITITDIIDSRAQYLITTNAETGQFDDLVKRDAQFGTLLGVESPTLNLGTINIRGLDTSLSYRIDTKNFGTTKLALNAARIKDYFQKLDPISQYDDISGTFVDSGSGGGGSIPNWKFNTGLNWTRKNLAINYNIYYISDLTESFYTAEVNPAGTTIEKQVIRKIPSWVTHNLQANYRPLQFQAVEVSVGIDNLFDKAPPFSASAFNDNFDPRTYEIKGRSWYAKFTYEF